eukprot:TRINITY_DN9749_c0_g1_i2.p1 TRINITY_DN9749_c0_g1~~TRINITY_DN9749_c0_g1_i2.p1  ORF type:complete len:482 (+),score=82.13 TRINITY_DN9749_c0_g1_i2:70-1515(+)
MEQFGLKSPLLGKNRAEDFHSGETVNSFVGYCYGMNFIVGVGVLTVPWAFREGGLILSTLTLLISTAISFIAMNWLLEVFCRTHALQMAQQPRNLENDSDFIANSGEPDYRIANRKFEIGELVGLFMGPKVQRGYEVVICIYMFGALWSYCSVFATSAATYIPIPFINDGNTCEDCDSLYYFYLAVFGSIVIPLSCMDLHEQVVTQVLLAVFRFVAIFIMISTSAYGIDKELPPDPEEPNSFDDKEDTTLFNFPGFGSMFAIVAFSQMFQLGVPTLTHPIKDRMKLRKIYFSLLSSTFLLYGTLGITLVSYYRQYIDKQCSLNWVDYDYRRNPSGDPPAFAYILSYLIVLFPALDVLSAFPLSAITLSNNLREVIEGDGGPMSKYRKIGLRLLSSIPPVLGAMAIRDISIILRYVGIFGFVINFVAPALLQIESTKTCKRAFPEHPNTPFTHRFMSQQWLPYAVIIFSFFGIIITFVNLFV